MGSLLSKYSTNPRAQETPRTQPTTSHSFTYDKLSWNVGTKVLIEQNGVNTECVIQQILCEYDNYKLSHSDLIKVRFEDNTIKTVYRYELKSTTLFLQKRYKLRLYCMVEIYSLSLNQWIPGYIDKYGTIGPNKQIITNDNIFSVNDTNYFRWSHHIRCCPQFSTLSKGSGVCIFDFLSNQWVYGQIVDIQAPVTRRSDGNHLNLDVFIIKYHKNGTCFTKYLHEFSASLALTDADANNTSNAAQYMESNTYTDMDQTDLLYHRRLFETFGGNNIVDITDMDHDLISIDKKENDVDININQKKKKKKKKKNAVLYAEDATKLFKKINDGKRFKNGITLKKTCDIFSVAWELPHENGRLLPSKVVRHFKHVLPKKPKQTKSVRRDSNIKPSIAIKSKSNKGNVVIKDTLDKAQTMRGRRTVVQLPSRKELDLGPLERNISDTRTKKSMISQLESLISSDPYRTADEDREGPVVVKRERAGTLTDLDLDLNINIVQHQNDHVIENDIELLIAEQKKIKEKEKDTAMNAIDAIPNVPIPLEQMYIDGDQLSENDSEPDGYAVPSIRNYTKNTEKGKKGYEWIKKTFQKVDKQNHEEYMANFERHKVEDHRLGDLLAEDWKELIPMIGPRNEFRRLWSNYNDNVHIDLQHDLQHSVTESSSENNMECLLRHFIENPICHDLDNDTIEMDRIMSVCGRGGRNTSNQSKPSNGNKPSNKNNNNYNNGNNNNESGSNYNHYHDGSDHGSNGDDDDKNNDKNNQNEMDKEEDEKEDNAETDRLIKVFMDLKGYNDASLRHVLSSFAQKTVDKVFDGIQQLNAAKKRIENVLNSIHCQSISLESKQNDEHKKDDQVFETMSECNHNRSKYIPSKIYQIHRSFTTKTIPEMVTEPINIAKDTVYTFMVKSLSIHHYVEWDKRRIFNLGLHQKGTHKNVYFIGEPLSSSRKGYKWRINQIVTKHEIICKYHIPSHKLPHYVDIEDLDETKEVEETLMKSKHEIIVSLEYNKSNNRLKVVGIHLDKELIFSQHQIISPSHCYSEFKKRFNSQITDIHIGNPDDDVNRVRALQKELKKLRIQQRNMKCLSLASSDTSTSDIHNGIALDSLDSSTFSTSHHSPYNTDLESSTSCSNVAPDHQ